MVIPVYNSASSLPKLIERLGPVLESVAAAHNRPVTGLGWTQCAQFNQIHVYSSQRATGRHSP